MQAICHSGSMGVSRIHFSFAEGEGMICIRRFVLCILISCLFFSEGIAEREIPDALRATQEIMIERMEYNRTVSWSVLHTIREDVNEAVNARVIALRKEAETLVPPGENYFFNPARADICTQITRTGDRWMSFHICAQVSANNQQKWVKSEEYTYEMDSGRLIRLGDVVREEGWEALLREIRTQASGFFPEEDADPDKLDGLCSRENLENAGFVVTPGHMALYYPASEIYPSHPEALLRIEVYVPGLWDILTEEARREMDCTGYALVALTYDDGPTKGRTRDVLNASVCHPGQITFFIVGNRISGNAELVHREFDAGHSVQSHTWQHSIDRNEVTPQKAAQWEKKLNRSMTDIIGIRPIIMRPPGGLWKLYAKAGIQTPMILWSIDSQDAGVQGTETTWQHYRDCALSANDGDIVLFHDSKEFAGDLAECCMERFEEKNVLLVTVNDLCALRDIPLEDGAIVHNAPLTDTVQ